MGNRWGNSERLFSWAPKSLQMVTAAMKIKRSLLRGRKAMTSPDSILNSRDITLPTKVCLVKAMVFPVVVYGCELYQKESWAPDSQFICYQVGCCELSVRDPLFYSRQQLLSSRQSTTTGLTLSFKISELFELWCLRDWESLGLQGDQTSPS